MERLNELLQEGSKYIVSGRDDEWKGICLKLCGKNGTDEIGLRIASASFEIIKLLHDTDMDYRDIVEKVDNGEHSGIEWRYVELIVAKFSEKGVDFVKATNKNSININLDTLKQQNEKNINKKTRT